VITTLQIPAEVVLGIANVAVIWVAEFQVTPVAVMLDEPECVNMTFGVATKFPPEITEVTEFPAYPLSGSISLKEGLEAAVVVAAVATVVAFVVTVVVTTVVGAAVGIDDTVTWVIFTLYTFSMVERGYVSVFEFIR
jgi:hypothetical protein